MSSNKVTIIGVGGVGSWIAEFLARAGVSIEVFDGDRVEERNLLYSNYSHSDLGRRKVYSLFDRIHRISRRDIVYQERELEEVSENGSDVIVLAVDSIGARIKLISSLERIEGQKWIDSRAEGRNYQIFTHASRMINDFLSVSDPSVRRGCQVDSGEIEAGNLICAARVTQITLDMIRNRPFPAEVIQDDFITG